jgi:hypothetical protein
MNPKLNHRVRRAAFRTGPNPTPVLWFRPSPLSLNPCACVACFSPLATCQVVGAPSACSTVTFFNPFTASEDAWLACVLVCLLHNIGKQPAAARLVLSTIWLSPTVVCYQVYTANIQLPDCLSGVGLRTSVLLPLCHCWLVDAVMDVGLLKVCLVLHAAVRPG